jgi:hypothetical protein
VHLNELRTLPRSKNYEKQKKNIRTVLGPDDEVEEHETQNRRLRIPLEQQSIGTPPITIPNAFIFLPNRNKIQNN